MNRSITVLLAFALATSPLDAQDIPLSKILVEKEGWRELGQGGQGVTFLLPEPGGTVTIFRGQLSGKIDAAGKIQELKKGAIRMARDQQSALSFSIDPGGSSIYRWSDEEKAQRVKPKGVVYATCLLAWPDEGHLVIGEYDGGYLWAFRVEKDGSLGPGDRYYSLRTKPGQKMHVTAMTMDASYLLYACTPIGIQVFDPTGRLCGVIAAPSKETMTAITIGGAKADELFVAAGDKIYARKIQGKAIYTLKKEK